MKNIIKTLLILIIITTVSVKSECKKPYWKKLDVRIPEDNLMAVQNRTESWSVRCVFELYVWDIDEEMYLPRPTNDAPDKRNTSDDGTWNQLAIGITHQWKAPGDISYTPGQNKSSIDVLITGGLGAGQTFVRSTCQGCGATLKTGTAQDEYLIIGWFW